MYLGRKTKNPVLNVLLLRCSCLQVSIQFLDSNRFLKINFKFCNQLLSAGIEGPPNIWGKAQSWKKEDTLKKEFVGRRNVEGREKWLLYFWLLSS